MKDFFEKLMTDEDSGQKFTVQDIILYGGAMTLGLILLMAFAGWMDTMSM